MKHSVYLCGLGRPSRLLAAMAAALLVSACSSWSSAPENKPQEVVLHAPLLGVQQAWTARVGTAFKPPLSMQAKGQVLTLASSDGEVTALDASTGRPLWHRALQEPLAAGVGADGDVAAVVSAHNELIVLVAGQEKWRQRLNAPVFTPPLVAGGRVFVLTADRNLLALDAGSGHRLWAQTPASSSENLVLRQAGVLTAINNTLLVGIYGRLAGVQPDTGTVLWESPLSIPRGTNEIERLVDVVGPVSKSNGVVCARAFQSAVGCLNASNGKILWTQKSQGMQGVDGDAQWLYGVESNGIVTAWNRSNGSPQWSSEQLKYRKLSAPLVLGRSVVVGDSAGNLYFLSKTDGSLLNRLTTDDSGISAQPVVAGNTLVVTTLAGKIYGFRPE